MLEGKSVAVVVPAHNEEALIEATLQGIPGFVDRVFVVDDGSSDATGERASSFGDRRVEALRHERNQGVGAAIVTGYRRALAERVDATAVMAAEKQMDPDELESPVLPVVRGEAGYTVIGLPILQQLDLERIYTSYGFPNDMLVHLNVWNARVRDFPSRPIYGVGERSGIRIRRVVPRISWLLWKGFFWRMREKYVIRGFHPLVFFYFLGFLMGTAGLALGILEV